MWKMRNSTILLYTLYLLKEKGDEIFRNMKYDGGAPKESPCLCPLYGIQSVAPVLKFLEQRNEPY